MQDDDGHAPGGAVGDAAIQGHDHVDNHHHTGRDRLSSSVGRGRVPTGRVLFHLAAALAFLRQQPSGQRCDPFGRDVLQDWGVRWRCLPSCLRSASRCTPGRTAGRFSKTTPRRPGKRFFPFCHSLCSSLFLLPSSLAEADRAGYRVAAPVRCLLLCPRLPGCLTVAGWPANAARGGHDAAILPHVWCSPSLLVTASEIVVCGE